LDFSLSHIRANELPMPQIHLPPQLVRRILPLVVKIAS
jgi:hypothetical protein